MVSNRKRKGVFHFSFPVLVRDRRKAKPLLVRKGKVSALQDIGPEDRNVFQTRRDCYEKGILDSENRHGNGVFPDADK